MMQRKNIAMYRIYGRAFESCTCADCPHLVRYGTIPGVLHYKCKAYGTSSSEATDWRRHWQACLLIFKELPSDHVPLFERLTKNSDNEPIKGQISMFEEVNQ